MNYLFEDTFEVIDRNPDGKKFNKGKLKSGQRKAGKRKRGREGERKRRKRGREEERKRGRKCLACALPCMHSARIAEINQVYGVATHD